MNLSLEKIYGLLALCLILLFTGCGDKEPIKVGFAGPLSGTLSDYGLSCRRGVVLAIEEINEAGGIDGRKIQLIVRDDKNVPDEAVKVDRELAAEGVAVILGHFTSTASMAAVPEMNKARMLLISPGATTSKLSGKDDYFIRSIEADDEKARGQAQFAFLTLGAKKAAFVYDIANRAYSEAYIRSIEEVYKKLGGSISVEIPFDSRQGMTQEKISTLIQSESDVAFIVMGALDAATLAQELAKQGSKIQLFSSPWAMRKELIENGGQAVEGFLLAGTLNMNANAPRLNQFKENFLKRFGEEADMASARGYDAAMTLKIGLENADAFDSTSIKDAILHQKNVPALNGDFPINRFGDAQRAFQLYVVEKGQFKIHNY